MFRLALASLFLVGMACTASPAQDVKVKEEKEVSPAKEKSTVTPVKPNISPVIPGDVEVHFLNGSKVRMIVQSDKLEIATQYGKLAVPVKDVKAIEFGLHYPEDVEAKIDA